MGQINKVSGSVELNDSDFTVASPGGDFFENDAATILVIKNASGATRTVTVHEATTCNFGHTAQPLVLSIPAGSAHFKTTTLTRSRFGGRTQLTYDDATGLSLVAIRIVGV